MTAMDVSQLVTAFGPAGTAAAFVWCAVEIKYLRKSVDHAHKRIDEGFADK